MVMTFKRTIYVYFHVSDEDDMANLLKSYI